MILPFDQNSSHIFQNNDIGSELDFTLSVSYDNENIFFPKKEDSFSDPLKTKPLSKDIELYTKQENLNKQESQKEIDLDKQIPPDYFDLKKIKDLLIGKLPNDIVKELDCKIFQENNLINFASNMNDITLIGKKRKKSDKKDDDKGKNEIKENSAGKQSIRTRPRRNLFSVATYDQRTDKQGQG